MQENILLFFSNYTSDIATFFAHAVSVCTEAVLPLLVICIVYWTVDKRVGINLAYCLGLSILINCMIKILVKAARPFEKIPELKARRLSTATGYSFPSTHSQTIATFMSSLSLYIKQSWLYALSVFAVITVGLSRIYFCVHWPIDVLCGILFGTIIGIVLYCCLEKILSNTLASINFASCIFVLSMLLFCLLLLVYYKLGLYPYAKIADNFKITGLVAGLSLANLFEILYLRFKPAETLKNKVLVLVLGFVFTGIIFAVLKLILPSNVVFCFVRYFTVGFWVAFGWPFVAKKLGLLAQE